MYKFIIKKIKSRLLASLLDTVNQKLSKNPSDSDALNNRAILSIGNDTLQESLKDMNEAITLNAKHHPILHYLSSAAHLFRGYTHLALGEKKKASEDFTESLFQDHENTSAEQALKISRNNNNDFDFSYVEKILEPYIEKDHSKTIEYLDQLYSSTKRKKILYEIAAHYYLLQNYVKSLLYLKQSISLDSNNGEAPLLIGLIYLTQQRYEKALMYLDKSISSLKQQHHDYHINSSVQYYNRGFIYYNMKKLDLACNDLTKAIELHNKNSEAFALRAKIYLAKHKNIQAIADIKQALEYDPNNPEALQILKKAETTT